MLLGNRQLRPSYQINSNSLAGGRTATYMPNVIIVLMMHKGKMFRGKIAKFIFSGSRQIFEEALPTLGDTKASKPPWQMVFICQGQCNFLWLNGCWGIDEAFPRNRTKSDPTEEKKKRWSCLVLQVAARASENKSCRRMRRQTGPDGQRHPEHFHLCSRQLQEQNISFFFFSI